MLTCMHTSTHASMQTYMLTKYHGESEQTSEREERVNERTIRDSAASHSQLDMGCKTTQQTKE